MPSVLITGLNGFVAVHTAIKFLKEGWDVVGTVRSASKGDKTLALPALADAKQKGKIKYVVVADLVEGDFSEGLKQVDAIAHCASPWHFNGTKWSDYGEPAIKGTSNIIEQATKFPNVRSIAVVSSVAAVMDIDRPFYELSHKKYTEDDWLPVSEQDAQNAQDDGMTTRGLWYCASKKYAELAALDLGNKYKDSFALSTLCPCVINGPAVHLDSAEAVKSADVSTVNLFQSLVSGSQETVSPTHYSYNIDVRDLAIAIYLAISKRATGRYLITQGAFDFDQLAGIVEAQRPDLVKAGVVPKHLPEGQTPLSKGSYAFENGKSIRELGMSYRSLEDTVRDTVEQFEKLGAVVKVN